MRIFLIINASNYYSRLLTEETEFKCVAENKEDSKIVDIFFLEDVSINHDGSASAEDPIYENSNVKFSCAAKSNPMASFKLQKGLFVRLVIHSW
jgi:hypothetical protein